MDKPLAHLTLADVERDVEEDLAGAVGRLETTDLEHQASPSPR